MYAKLENGVFIEAPRYIKYNGYVYHNPTGEICIANGYYPVIESPYPEVDDKTYEPHYEYGDQEIIQTWVEVVEEPTIYNEQIVFEEIIEDFEYQFANLDEITE